MTDRDYCRQADDEMLVEAYVSGKLKGDVLKNFEDHLKICEKHAQAVSLEKALKRGITEFARSQMKLKIQKRLEKQQGTRFMLLRYAAILLVAVITPLLIYYQFNIAPRQLPLQSAKDISILPGKKIAPLESPAPASVPPAEVKEQLKMEIKAKTKIESARSQDANQIDNHTEGAKYTLPLLESAASDERSKKTEVEPALTAAGKSVYEARREPGLNKMPPGRVSPGTIPIQISVNHRTELDQKVQEDSSRIGLCIRSHLSPEQRSAYRLILILQIQENGEIDMLEVKSATFRSEELETCLADVINSWMIGAGKAEQIEYEIHYPPS